MSTSANPTKTVRMITLNDSMQASTVDVMFSVAMRKKMRPELAQRVHDAQTALYATLLTRQNIATEHAESSDLPGLIFLADSDIVIAQQNLAQAMSDLIAGEMQG